MKTKAQQEKRHYTITRSGTGDAWIVRPVGRGSALRFHDRATAEMYVESVGGVVTE